MLARGVAPSARTIVRTANVEYLEVWRERQLDFDFVVSSEEETARAGDQAIVPQGNAAIEPGDRVIIIGSPAAAREWSSLMARGKRRVDDVVIFGCGHAGTAIARELITQGIAVRMIETDRERARQVADDLPA